jgi:hypothetical protein
VTQSFPQPQSINVEKKVKLSLCLTKHYDVWGSGCIDPSGSGFLSNATLNSCLVFYSKTATCFGRMTIFKMQITTFKSIDPCFFYLGTGGM